MLSCYLCIVRIDYTYKIVMTKKYRIAHLSDLHLSPEYFPERTIMFKHILEQCVELNVDHIIISGDITHQAKSSEFVCARNVLQEFDLLHSHKLTVTIGNHDIYGGPFHAEDVLLFPAKCKEVKYEEKVKEFYETFHESFEGCKFISAHSIFPFVKEVGGVALLGLNSIAQWNTLRNPLGSNGEIDGEQYSHLNNIFKSNIIHDIPIFTVVHHHFNALETKKDACGLAKLWQFIELNTMKLHRRKQLLELFNLNGVSRVLHGHVHTHEEYCYKDVQCLNAGGTMIPEHSGEKKFHLLTVADGEVTHRDIIFSTVHSQSHQSFLRKIY